MSIPSRAEAAAILRGLQPTERLLEHCATVGEIAAFICAAMDRRGVTIDGPLVETAALLHDLDKALPQGHDLRKLGHGTGGAEWLRQNGYGELATAVASHPVGVLADAESYEDFVDRVGLEGCVVAYADKRALQDIVSLDARFDRWDRRYPGSETLTVARARARQLERDVCTAAGIAPEEVSRLAWVADAMRAGA